ncbi:MAG: energy transducer TonB [Polaromonas sp.]|nr:energy transducer TonB [Polaromonas sp.]
MPSLGLPAGSRSVAKKPPPLSRNAAIALAVVVLHIGFIWALQSGLLMRAVEIVVPVEVLSQFIDPPAPKLAPEPPIAKVAPTPVKKAVTTPMAPAPQPLAIADPTPSPNAPVGVTTPQPPLAPIAAPVAATPIAPAAAAAPATVQLPSSDADYLQNPRPPYPPLSKRLNEQGKTIVRVLIGVDGLPQRSEIAKSSGFDRLDQAAIATVMRWRYVPGKRGGVPEAMWFNVPINWVLE